MPLPEAGKLKYPGFQQWYREKLRLDITGEKQVLRRKFSALRKSLSSETRQQYNAAICAAIASLECFRQAEFIAAYIPFGGEVDLSPLFCGKQVLLPRFVPERGVYELVCVDDNFIIFYNIVN